MMRLIRGSKGQNIAEYAVLFAIVIGAAIAMQQYVKSRLQGAMQKSADDYVLSVQAAPFEPVRTVNSSSNQTDSMAMSSATSGSRTLTTTGTSSSVTTK